MRAIRVTQPGGPEALRLAELPVPVPGKGQVRITLRASGVNYIDVYERTGLYPQPLPFTPGVEGAGVVDALGDGVADLRVGDRVAWAMHGGSYAEQAVVDAWKVVTLPAEIEFATAAALLLQGMTAHYLACSTFPVGPGHTALVHAAAGGAGRLLVQVCKLRGAKVIGTVSSAAKAEIARAAGCDRVIRYDQESFTGVAADVVYDSVGKATFTDSLAALRPRGMLVLYGQSSGKVPPFDLNELAARGSLFVTRPALKHHAHTREEIGLRMRDLFAWLARGAISVRIDRTLPLAAAAQAHALLESRATAGKLLLLP